MGTLPASLAPQLCFTLGQGAYNSVVDNFRVIDLASPWNTDYSFASQRLAGTVNAGTAFIHTANAVIEFTITTLHTAGNINVFFRNQDATNGWFIQITSTGTINLFERVAGVDTNRANAAAGVASGHRIVIITENNTIRVYSNNTLRFTYANAVNFSTAIAGEMNSLGTAGVITNLVAWPRVISGLAAEELKKGA